MRVSLEVNSLHEETKNCFECFVTWLCCWYLWYLWCNIQIFAPVKAFLYWKGIQQFWLDYQNEWWFRKNWRIKKDWRFSLQSYAMWRLSLEIKTRSQWRLKCLHTKYPPQSQQPANIIICKPSGSGDIDFFFFQAATLWSLDQRVIIGSLLH